MSVCQEEQEDDLLQKILSSHAFERTYSLNSLLSYLWEHRGQQISEYAIATEALGRLPNFDSKADATVRVQIGRLRKLLDKFYATEGAHHTRRLTIPIGSHEVTVITVERAATADAAANPEEAASNATAPVPTPLAMRLLISAPLGFTLLGLLLLCSVLLTMGLLRRNPASGDRTELPPFWKLLLKNGKNTRIVLPAPLFFSWRSSDGESLMLRDITVNDPAKKNESAALMHIMGRDGQTHIWQNYTVASDTFASIRLARFLDGYGIRTSFSSATGLPHEIVDHENLITFGTKNSLAPYQSDLDRLTFRMSLGESSVADLLSPPEHRKEFLRVHESAERDIVLGIIAVIPRANADGWLMLLQGTDTMAIIAYLTSEEGTREMRDAMHDMKSPYFEAVILSEVNRGIPLQSRLGALREFVPRPPETMAKLLQVQENNK